MNTSFQFAPIRVYSGARSNKKCKAITEFLTEMFDRKFFDRNNTSRESIQEVVKNECSIIDEKSSLKGRLSVSCTNTNEYNDQRDWKMVVVYVKENGEPVSVCDLLCFCNKGGILGQTVDCVSQTVGECVRKKYGIV